MRGFGYRPHGFLDHPQGMRGHKSLRAWQEAHKVVHAVLDVSEELWRPSIKAVLDQLQRASLSVQLNIAEGYGAGSRARFHYHLTVAYGSAIETGDLLEILYERRVISGEAGSALLKDSYHAQRLLLGLIKRYSKTSPDARSSPAVP